MYFIQCTPVRKIKQYTDEDMIKIKKISSQKALDNSTYNELINELKRSNIYLQYDDEFHKHHGFIKRVTGQNWSSFKDEINKIHQDYKGIKPLRNGYAYNGELYENLTEAHLTKIKNEYPDIDEEIAIVIA